MRPSGAYAPAIRFPARAVAFSISALVIMCLPLAPFWSDPTRLLAPQVRMLHCLTGFLAAGRTRVSSESLPSKRRHPSPTDQWPSKTDRAHPEHSSSCQSSCGHGLDQGALAGCQKATGYKPRIFNGGQCSAAPRRRPHLTRALPRRPDVRFQAPAEGDQSLSLARRPDRPAG